MEEDDKLGFKDAEFELTLTHPGEDVQQTAPPKGLVLRTKLWVRKTALWRPKYMGGFQRHGFE